MSFFVCDPWTTELHEMIEKCFQMLKSLFSHDCMVFLSRRYHPPLPVRENCPFWMWLNGQTMGSDNWFLRLSVTIFKQFAGSSFSHSKAKNDDSKSDS